MNILLIIIIVIFLAIIVMASLNAHLPKWVCSKLGWHLAPKEQHFDGASLYGICPRCGKKVLQDSQGNWFNIT